ncbi:MBL fold metallo-hydrolase [Psychrobium sp. 1_MG-2023]|uniref:MBL fold metallo-hydrolase n=1 Tax=Psychrobium sp. 1_MG-2023 TaxID=3062624 RepID=UPI000C337B63|nr:MBL fold metallo-hydrolase [Psychrobium sp. 1_MG-2023]MDP2562840.1 MBL fold metallo-hydrolase [Psychrobium sp. 1_MG-2023]PKF54279.1 Zn-dependent hydrolase [Alteromonadales bacterium alter-6D02]
MKRLVVSLVALAIAGCSTANNIETISPKEAVVKHSDIEGYQDRFANIYGKFSDYPATCQKDCYPPSELIQCESSMQGCEYVGSKPTINLEAGFTIQWLGHASFVINTADGQQFLFDPVSAQFDWPVNWAFRLSEGFNRNLPTQLSAGVLNKTAAVMYSHIHYDHFNKDDIAKIGSSAQFLTPLGFAKQFPEDGYDVTEMAWYSSKQLGQVTANFVPAHHFSSRILVPFIHEDHNATLWGGWVLEYQGKKLFFAGDTGYSPHFKDIQERYGDIDVCLIPIASYFSEEHPKWYRKVHTTPEDALQAATDLNCKVMIPWGYGNASWQMGDRTSHSALFRLLHMKDQLNSNIPLYILNEGEQVKL